MLYLCCTCLLKTPHAYSCRYISLVRLLRLGRAYRLFGWVTFLTYNQTVSLLVVTLVRNFMVGALPQHQERTHVWSAALPVAVTLTSVAVTPSLVTIRRIS
jgi:hypothetical protein